MQSSSLQLANLYVKRNLINWHITREMRIIRIICIIYYIIYISYIILHSTRLTELIYATVETSREGETTKAEDLETLLYRADL